MANAKRAVIVGVNKYEHADDQQIPELKGAENDAQEMCDRLKASGFEIAHFLTKKDANCQGIRKAISDLFWSDEPSDVSLFYFSGHGFQDSYGNGYLAPWDISWSEPFVCGVRMQELREMVLRSKKKDSIIVILDCCYSGIITAGKGEATLAPKDLRVNDWFSAVNENAQGKFILASSGTDSKSREIRCSHEMGQGEHDHGEFTFHLLEGLDGKAAETEDVTLRNLCDYLRIQMPNETKLFGTNNLLVKDVPVAKASQRRKMQELLSDAESKLGKDSPLSVFKAAKQVCQVFEQCPKWERALELEARINAKLAQYQKENNKWVGANAIDVFADYPDWGNYFENCVLSVDFIWKQSEPKRNLLANLCLVSLEQIPVDRFVERLREAGQAAPSIQNPLSDAEKPGMALKVGTA